MKKTNPHILYSILDWGLGHATRSIPIIEELLLQGARVTLCGEGSTGHLIQSVFPQLAFHTVNGIQVKYPTRIPMSLSMFLQSPKISLAIKNEHQQIKKLVKDLQVDAIISDNRYGAFADGIPSVIITHQLNLQTPKNKQWLRPIINKINHHYLTPFDEIWVPDSPGENNLTGSLSHDAATVQKLKPKYIGSLSRFASLSVEREYKNYDAIVVLSGPEPQRSYFEKIIDQQLQDLPITAIIAKGTPRHPIQEQHGNCFFSSHISTDEMLFHYTNCKYIISRSGHSTLMDLCAVKKSAICIPTPGQTEQEFLAEMHSRKKHIVAFDQVQVDLKRGMEMLEQCTPFDLSVNQEFKPTIKIFFDRI
ncbi:MAG: glycosyltransferase [Bacteroidetes bacterium]|nr:glycosyltransferase [Bacteroidota bacterium]